LVHRSDLLAPATSYMFYRALALPATLVSMVGAAACLGQRDSATPLRVAGLSGLVNLVVDLYLVMGPPQMGITGAAIATAGSQILAAALYMTVLARRIEIKFRVPYWSRVKPFVTAGSVLTLRSICIMTVRAPHFSPLPTAGDSSHGSTVPCQLACASAPPPSASP
jgi:Na+-driven multidrug efflux pump